MEIAERWCAPSLQRHSHTMPPGRTLGSGGHNGLIDGIASISGPGASDGRETVRGRGRLLLFDGFYASDDAALFDASGLCLFDFGPRQELAEDVSEDCSRKGHERCDDRVEGPGGCCCSYWIHLTPQGGPAAQSRSGTDARGRASIAPQGVWTCR